MFAAYGTTKYMREELWGTAFGVTSPTESVEEVVMTKDQEKGWYPNDVSYKKTAFSIHDTGKVGQLGIEY